MAKKQQQQKNPKQNKNKQTNQKPRLKTVLCFARRFRHCYKSIETCSLRNDMPCWFQLSGLSHVTKMNRP